MGWIVLLPSLALWRVLSKRVSARGRIGVAVNVAVMIVMFVAGCGFALTFLARWMVKPLSMLPSHDVRVGVSAALVILAVVTMVADIAVDRQADRAAQWAAFATPALVLLVAGSIFGLSGQDVVHGVINQVGPFFQDLGNS